MASSTQVTADYWNRQTANSATGDSGRYWLEIAEVHRRINKLVSGDADVDWLAYALGSYFSKKLPLARVLSLACGEGGFERSLARKKAFEQCDAYDLSPGSVQQARLRAESEGISGIHYDVADMNTMTFPKGVYDAVWINSGAHHFANLEHVFAQLRLALKNDGLLIMNDYIGPDRFQFPLQQKEVSQLCLKLLPSKFRIEIPKQSHDQSSNEKAIVVKSILPRLLCKLKQGGFFAAVKRRLKSVMAKAEGKSRIKSEIRFPTVADVSVFDPSEAVRSGEILDVLQHEFDIVERKDWGGNILQFLLADIAGNFRDDAPESIAFLKMLMCIEDTYLSSGEFASDFAFIVARPK